jgi:putative transposase
MEHLKSGCYFHIYNRGNNKELVFFNDENYFYFLRLFKKHVSEIAEVYSYCLLPNHFHFLIKIKDEHKLPNKYVEDENKLHQPFSNLFNAYTKAINNSQQRTGSLFQRNYRKNQIKDDKQLQNTIIYINTNSNHHGLEDYKLYRYSSFKALTTTNNKTSINKELIGQYFDNVSNFKTVLEYKKESIEILDNLE